MDRRQICHRLAYPPKYSHDLSPSLMNVGQLLSSPIFPNLVP
jgi:hypothetical protein